MCGSRDAGSVPISCPSLTHSRTRHAPGGDPEKGHCLVTYHTQRYADEPFGLILGFFMKCPKCRHENEEGAINSSMPNGLTRRTPPRRWGWKNAVMPLIDLEPS